MPDDALALHRRADHEARHVREEHERDIERVAGPDEAGSLVSRVAEQDAALVVWLVGHDPDHPALQAGEAHDQLPGPARVDLEQRALVDQGGDQHLHVKRLVLIGRDQLRDVLPPALPRRRWRRRRRRALPAAGQV